MSCTSCAYWVQRCSPFLIDFWTRQRRSALSAINQLMEYAKFLGRRLLTIGFAINAVKWVPPAVFKLLVPVDFRVVYSSGFKK